MLLWTWHVAVSFGHILVVPEFPVEFGSLLIVHELRIKLLGMFDSLVDFDKYPGSFGLERIPGTVNEIGR